jgi:ABC-type uncharacterized transport system permease subunit
MKRILRSADVQSGLLFIALAALILWLSSHLRMGTAMRMGPGYLPSLLSYLLFGLGILTLALGVRNPATATERWYLRPLLAVTAAIVVFAYGIADLGLFVTTVLLVMAASVATPESRPLEVAAVALGLASFSTALFVRALGLPMPAWPAFLVS